MHGLLLAVDTSSKAAGMALYDGIRVRAETMWESPRRHTVELTTQLVAMLKQLKIGASALTGLAVALGPGTFTGLRIGLALTKGLAISRSIPIAGIPTLDVTAYPVHRGNGLLFAALQAGRGRICVAPYRWDRGRWRQDGDLTITTWAALATELPDEGIVSGEIDAAGLEILDDYRAKIKIVSAAHRLRRAGYLAELGWKRLTKGERDDPATLQPIYLHTV